MNKKTVELPSKIHLDFGKKAEREQPSLNNTDPKAKRGDKQNLSPKKGNRELKDYSDDTVYPHFVENYTTAMEQYTVRIRIEMHKLTSYNSDVRMTVLFSW